MIRREVDGVVWWEFELLADHPVRHGIFTRHGGVSRVPFTSLNVGLSVGDNPADVQTNIERIGASLSTSTLHYALQCHGKDLQHVDADTLSVAAYCDGLHSALPEIGLLIKHADCQPTLFYDPVRHVAANVHSGWRGSVQNIYGETVQALVATHGCNPKDLLVCVGPSLGPKNAQFIHYRTELPEHFWAFQPEPNYFDFWNISRFQLEQAGVLPGNIQIAEIDTFDATEDFFSHRKEKSTGRNATVIVLER